MTSTRVKRLAITGGQKVVFEKLKVRWPIITKEDKDAVMRVLDRKVLWGAYAPEVVGLQEDFARYIGSKYCIAVNSGTAVLHMAVAAAGVGPGDEVITPAFSFLASAIAIMHHNAIPVFVDIELKTYNIDFKKIEEKITQRTRAIIPVHIHFTQLVRIDICRDSGIHLRSRSCQSCQFQKRNLQYTLSFIRYIHLSPL